MSKNSLYIKNIQYKVFCKTRLLKLVRFFVHRAALFTHPNCDSFLATENYS